MVAVPNAPLRLLPEGPRAPSTMRETRLHSGLAQRHSHIKCRLYLDTRDLQCPRCRLRRQILDLNTVRCSGRDDKVDGSGPPRLWAEVDGQSQQNRTNPVSACAVLGVGSWIRQERMRRTI